MEKKPSAARGELLPAREYEVPILSVLVQHGGRAPVTEVIDEVGTLLDGRFTEADRELVASGFIMWKNRAFLARMNLIKTGEMVRECRDGTWGITEEGRARALSSPGAAV